MFNKKEKLKKALLNEVIEKRNRNIFDLKAGDKILISDNSFMADRRYIECKVVEKVSEESLLCKLEWTLEDGNINTRWIDWNAQTFVSKLQ